ncbi:hypothetical protein HanPI659440_Chr15g0598191 [Helianthus annuus]|nr:hypothetical protein HanPI659440_Chr15g0598191 [Helianthus annuus]
MKIATLKHTDSYGLINENEPANYYRIDLDFLSFVKHGTKNARTVKVLSLLYSDLKPNIKG